MSEVDPMASNEDFIPFDRTKTLEIVDNGSLTKEDEVPLTRTNADPDIAKANAEQPTRFVVKLPQDPSFELSKAKSELEIHFLKLRQDLQSRADAHMRDLKKCREEHKRELQRLRDEHLEQLQNAEDRHERRLKRLAQECNDHVRMPRERASSPYEREERRACVHWINNGSCTYDGCKFRHDPPLKGIGKMNSPSAMAAQFFEGLHKRKREDDPPYNPRKRQRRDMYDWSD